MSEKIQYRIRQYGIGTSWSEWKDYDSSFFVHDGYVEMQKVRDYKEGTTLIPKGYGVAASYVVLSDEVYTENTGAALREFIACKVIYENGDWSLDFIAKDRLDACEIKGE